MDIEDLKLTAESEKTCPFYTFKNSLDEAEIIFLPYNYIIDPRVRGRLGLNLNKDIVILDEAHNISSLCQDTVSFDLTANVLGRAIYQLTTYYKKISSSAHEINDLQRILTDIKYAKQIF